MAPHPSLDHTQSLFKTHVFGRLVVVVGLHVECCDVIHHLQTEKNRCDTSLLPAIMPFILHVSYLCAIL